MEIDYLKKHVKAHPHLLGKVLMSENLTEIHSRWIKDVWESETNYALQIHRGALKTTAITIVGTLWWMLFHPNDRIAIVRKGREYANSTVSTIYHYAQTETYKELFFQIHGYYPKIEKGARGSFSLITEDHSITREYTVTPHSIEENMTGNYYSKILCDDIVTYEDYRDKIVRKRACDNLTELVVNVCEPTGTVMHIGTPRHRDDAWSIAAIPSPQKVDVHQSGLLSDEEINLKQRLTSDILFSAGYLLEV